MSEHPGSVEAEKDRQAEAFAIEHVRRAFPGDEEASAADIGSVDGRAFGFYWAFGAERAALSALAGDIEAYVATPAKKPKPFSVAIFGPPGCGKSFLVEQLRAHVSQAAGDPATINLTQIRDVGDLATALAEALYAERVSGASDPPFIFFDEFDTARDGAALGWLSWFLAPMNDGVFRHDGRQVQIGRAILVFAGGTCHTAAEFVSRTDSRFRDAKGPDFSSRLHGTFDVPGPNTITVGAARHRMLRRAALIAGAVRKRWKRRTEAAPTGFDEGFLRQLLGLDRYTHGSRSVNSFVHGLQPPSTDGAPGPIDRRWLPADGRLAAFFDRGAFDPALVGGPIQLSGGADAEDVPRLKSMWSGVSRRLFREGASVIYGGRVDGEPTSLTSVLTELTLASEPLPRHPDEPADARGMHRLHVFGALPAANHPATADKWAQFVRCRPAPASAAPDAVVKAVDLFQMRLYMARNSVACVAMGGKIEGWSGRMPGLLEELILAALHGRPVYVVGGPDMAVGSIGTLLNLDSIWAGTPAWLLEPGPRDEAVRAHADLFRWPGAEDAPLTAADAVETLRRFALGSPGWIDNGLTEDENRALFATDDATRATDLIVQGLTKVLGPR